MEYNVNIIKDITIGIMTFWLALIQIYVYCKILDIKALSKPKVIAVVLYSLLFSIFVTWIIPETPMFLSSLVNLIFVFVFVALAAKVKTSRMIAGALISVGISAGIGAIVQLTILFATYIVMLIAEIIYCMQTNTEFVPATLVSAQTVNSTVLDGLEEAETIALIASAILNITDISLFAIFIIRLFKTERLKKGLLIWQDKDTVFAGTLFSIILIINKEWDNGIINISIAVIGVVGMYYWWRGHTTSLYLQRIKERDSQRYIAEIKENIRQIKEISESNNCLAKAVHRDNKLIPAMFEAVSDFLRSTANTSINAKGMILLRDLEEMMLERKELILAIQREHKPLPSTGIDRIDNIVRHMFSKAIKDDIEFDFVQPDSIIGIGDMISTQQLETLLADLIENAIIAVSYNDYKRIQVMMCKADDCFEITVMDSGIPFEPETLCKLGVKQTTTHADTGGSGIGYMSIFEILGKSKASLTIMEYEPQEYAFSKAINVRFDEKAEYTVNSFRVNEINLSVNSTFKVV